MVAYDPTQGYAQGTVVTYNGVDYYALQTVPAGRLPGMPTATKYNTAEGGTDGATATLANSGGTSGDAWNSMVVPTNGSITYQTVGGRKAYAIYGGGTAAGSFGNVRWTFTAGANTKIYSRVRFRTTAVSADYYGIINFTAASFLFGPNAGKFCIRSGATIAALATGTYTLLDNTWYIFETYAEAGVGCTVRVYSDTGTLLDTITYTGAHAAAGTTLSNISYGYARFTETHYIDDAQVSHTDWVSSLPDVYWRSTAYSAGLYGEGVYGGGSPPPPTGQTNYVYGAGTYGEGPYYGYVGAGTDSNPTDNPTYGSGTYGYGIYYGESTVVKDAIPLFNDIAGTGQPPLHIIGIGPWSPVIHWRGAANYGVGAGNLPARPHLAMPPATSKGFTLRLDEGDEARFELNLSRGSAVILDEMDTDVWWRRKDPRTKKVEIIGRFNVSHANTSTSDTGINVSVQCDDYKTILGERRILRYKDVTNSETQWDQGTPITEILKWAIPGNTRLDLSELDTYDLGAVTATGFHLPPGTTIAEVMEQLIAVSPIRWEWWIETPNDINQSPKLRFQLGTRGLDKGVVLFDLGKGPSPIASWTRRAAADDYANSIIYSGSQGAVVQVIDAQVLQYGQRDTTAGNSTIDGTQIQLMRARAKAKLAKLATRTPSYTIQLASGFWRGREHIDVGDTITLILRLGKETLKEKHRVTEITVDIDSQGAEEVALTLGTPPPSADPRSKRAPLQRIVRHLREYKAPPGSERVIMPDEE